MKIKIADKDAYRIINPGCVSLLTSAYRDRTNIMALAWHAPVSKHPPLVSIAVAHGHFTCELIGASEEFVINIPGVDLLDTVQHCGSRSGRKADKFEETGLTPVQGTKVRAPLIDECLAHIECGVIQRYKLGDHFLFIGEVQTASADKTYFTDRWEENVELIHHLGGTMYYVNGRQKEIDK